MFWTIKKPLFNVATFVKEILTLLKEIIWISRTHHSACKIMIWEYWYSLIDTCGLCWRGRVSQAGYVIASHSILWVAVACPCLGCLLLVAKYMYISSIFIHVLVLLCESVFQCVCVWWRCYLCDFVYSFVYICIHVCIYSTVFLLIACIIGLCWLCIIVSCEFALQIL